jgi:hypothetical protein
MAAILARMSLSDGTALVPLLRCELNWAAELVIGKLSLRPDIMRATLSYARAASRAVGAKQMWYLLDWKWIRAQNGFVGREALGW